MPSPAQPSSAAPPPSQAPPSASASSPLSGRLLLGLTAVCVAGGLYLAFRWWRAGGSRLGRKGGRRGAAVPGDVVERVNLLIEQIARGEVDEVDVSVWRGYLEAACLQARGRQGEGGVSAEACLALIRLFASYHTVRSLVLVQEGGAVPPRDLQRRLSQLEQEQSADLTQAWDLLQQPQVQQLHQQPRAAQLAQARDAASVVEPTDLRLLALELAQRLKDAAKLRAAYARLMELAEADMSDEQVLAAFMTAPLLGRWRDTRALGQKLLDRKGPTVMDEFHGAALQEAVYPDYALLFMRSADWQSRETVAQPALAWEKYDVTEILVRHDQSFNPDPVQNAQLQQIVAGQREQREISPPRGHYPFLVTGAIARMQSPFIVELPCVGPYTADKFSLAAYAIIPAQTDPNSGLDMPATWVEVLIDCAKESVVNGGAERSFTGTFQVKEYQLSGGEGGHSHGKGPLTVMHQFHIDVVLQRA